MEKRVFENPLIKDKVTIVESPAETGGRYMLLEVELQPKGGNELHYHTDFSEEFIPVKGELGVGLGKEKLLLRPGQQVKAAINQRHHFFNPGNSPICFHVKIEPANEGFLQALKIMYGLAEDGLATKKGLPKKMDHLALLVEMSGTRPVGFISLLLPFLLRRANNPNVKKIKEALIEKYC